MNVELLWLGGVTTNTKIMYIGLNQNNL